MRKELKIEKVENGYILSTLSAPYLYFEQHKVHVYSTFDQLMESLRKIFEAGKK